MKLLTIILFSVLLHSPSGWITDFDQAKSEAAATHRFILLNFSGSDWCVPCIKLKKEIFTSESFIAFADTTLVLVNADFPRNSKNKLTTLQVQHNEALADQYNAAGKFPLTLLLTSDGRILKEWEGYPDTEKKSFVAQIKTVCDANK